MYVGLVEDHGSLIEHTVILIHAYDSVRVSLTENMVFDSYRREYMMKETLNNQGSDRVLRGGAMGNIAKRCLSECHFGWVCWDRAFFMGFRLIRKEKEHEEKEVL